MNRFMDRLVNGRAIVLLDGLVILPLCLFVVLHGHAVGNCCLRRRILFTENYRRWRRLLAKFCQRFSRQNNIDVAFRRVGVNLASGRTGIIRPMRRILRRRQLAAEASTAAAATLPASLTAA